MKKYILLIILALPLTIAVNAQKVSDLVIKNTCDCLNNTNVNTYSYDALTEVLANCMATDLVTHFAALKEEFGITDTDYSDAMEKIGENLGARMILSCPKFAEISLKMLQEDGDLRNEVLDDMGKKTMVFSGKVEKVKTEGFTGISVSSKDESLYFLWIEKFEGSQAFEKNPDALKGKNVEISYYEVAMYDGATKTYVKRKVISGLKVV